MQHLLSKGQQPSNKDCLVDKNGDYQNCSLLYSILQLRTSDIHIRYMQLLVLHLLFF